MIGENLLISDKILGMLHNGPQMLTAQPARLGPVYFWQKLKLTRPRPPGLNTYHNISILTLVEGYDEPIRLFNACLP